MVVSPIVYKLQNIDNNYFKKLYIQTHSMQKEQFYSIILLYAFISI